LGNGDSEPTHLSAAANPTPDRRRFQEPSQKNLAHPRRGMVAARRASSKRDAATTPSSCGLKALIINARKVEAFGVLACERDRRYEGTGSGLLVFAKAGPGEPP
jgi:hypothetical protein